MPTRYTYPELQALIRDHSGAGEVVHELSDYFNRQPIDQPAKPIAMSDEMEAAITAYQTAARRMIEVRERSRRRAA